MIGRIQAGTSLLVCLDVDILWEFTGAEKIKAVLSHAELERAGRFHSFRLQRRFMTGRFFLKQFLAAILGFSAEQIEFGYSTNGKPFLNPLISGEQLPCEAHFNFSRSQQYAVCGYSAGGRIGIDIERLLPMHDMASVAAVIFGADDLASWHSFSKSERETAFYRGWTRKEAAVKLVGRGISQGVKDVIAPLCSFSSNQAARVKVSGNEDGPSNDSTAAVLSEWSPFADVLINIAIEVMEGEQNEVAYSDFEHSIADLGLNWPETTRVVRRVFDFDWGGESN